MKNRNAWRCKSVYILHDIIVRLNDKHPDAWNEKHPLLNEWEWYMEHRDEYLNLPSDTMLPPEKWRMKALKRLY